MSRCHGRYRRIRLILAIIAGTWALGGGLVVPGVAQDLAGTTVEYAAPDGSVRLAFTVEEIVDPFPFTGERGGPADGHRFVAIRLIVQNLGESDIRFNPNDVKLLDNRHGLISAKRITRSQEDRASAPDLALGQVAAGQIADGFIFYELAQDAAITRILIQPAFDQLVILAELGGSPGGGSTDEQSPVATPIDPALLNEVGTFQAQEFSVSWDTAVWWAAEAISTEGYDYLRLEADATAIFIEGVAGYAGDPQSCLADAVEGINGDPSTSEFMPAENLTPPTANATLPGGAGLFTFAHDDGSARPTAIVAYVECRTLVAGESVLLITAVIRARYYEVDRELVAAALAGIAIPGE